jgi:hypothetical protein
MTTGQTALHPVRAPTAAPSQVRAQRTCGDGPGRPAAPLRCALALACLALLAGGCRAEEPARPRADAEAHGKRIQPAVDNPWYWQYRGEPVLLLGASVDDNLFQIPDLEAHLDAMQAAGGNYVRNTMSDRREQGFEVYPFLRLPDGRYDLGQWNDEYWRRFEALLRLTFERDIVVQIEIWDRVDYSREHWPPHPYNPPNNVNYSRFASSLAPEYPWHPARNFQPFFFTTPEQRWNHVVLQYQRRFVEAILERALPYPHVLYCLDNETRAEEAWSTYWAEFVHERARVAGVRAYVTEMLDDHDLRSEDHRRTFDHPERYGFVEVSQNNQQQGQTHWDHFQWARSYLSERPRPMNTVKTYGAEGGRHGNARDGLERWWRHLIGGAAAVRFHRPPSGHGLSETAKTSLRAARKLESLVRLWEVEPRLDLLRDREENEAYLTARPGRAYALYFPDGGSLELDLSDQGGVFEVRWIEIATGDWGPTARLEGGAWRRLVAPGEGHWAVVVLRAGS